MSNYTQTTSFAPKDALPSNDPNKTIYGAAFDTEFGNIATAIASKPDPGTTASFLNVAVTGSAVPANGIYLPVAGTLGFSANAGTVLGTLSAAGLTMPAFVPSAATVPTNGMYLSAANTVAFASNSTLALSLTATAATFVAVPGGAGITSLFASPPAIGGTAPAAGAFTTLSATSTVSGAGITALFAAPPAIGGTTPAAGAFTTLAGTAITASTSVTTPFLTVNGNTVPANGIYLPAANTLGFASNTAQRGTVNSTGNWSINAPSSGVALTVNAVSGTHSTQIADSANNKLNAGFLEVPPNAQTISYTCVLADSGKSIDMNGNLLTVTIPANASVAYPVGTTLTFTNLNASNLSIAITTDTMTKAGSTTTGTRTLSQNGVATARKVGTTSWIISGTGLT